MTNEEVLAVLKSMIGRNYWGRTTDREIRQLTGRTEVVGPTVLPNNPAFDPQRINVEAVEHNPGLRLLVITGFHFG